MVRRGQTWQPLYCAASGGQNSAIQEGPTRAQEGIARAYEGTAAAREQDPAIQEMAVQAEELVRIVTTV